MAPLFSAPARGSGRRAGRRRTSIVLAAVLAVSIPLVGPLTAPADARPVYPSSDDVKSAKDKAAQARSAVTTLSDNIDAAEARMDGLRVKAEQASEAYNAAQVKLEEAKSTAKAAASAATNARRDLAVSREELGEFAAASYRSGGDIANVGALLTADGPGTLMDRANTLSQLSTQRDYVLQRVESARVVTELLDEQAKGALTDVQAATASVRTTQLQAQAAVDQQVASINSLNAQKATLRTRLASLDRKSADLIEQRAAGIRAEAARKARAEAKSNGAKVPSNAPGGSSAGTSAGGRAAVEFAKSKLGTWYLWGGTGPRYDCSGLVMRAWEASGVQLPRVASWQYAATRKISTDALRPGDLVFYASDLSNYQTIHHVGIYVGGGQMIEAPHTGAKVRYASIWRSDLIGAGRP